MTRKTLTSLYIFILALMVLPAAARAQSAPAPCLPGAPCILEKTDNDPQNLNDGPNKTGINMFKSESLTCDADFMNQIYARAFLEAERENIINKVSIRKPDSVMEYSCFDKLVGQVAAKTGPIFSESDDWILSLIPMIGYGFYFDFNVIAVVPGYYELAYFPIPLWPISVYMGDTKLDSSLEAMVLSALNLYVNGDGNSNTVGPQPGGDDNPGSFSHFYLGGAALGIDNHPLGGTIDGKVDTGSFICADMGIVYALSKCKDFAWDDQFYTFDQLKTMDPRIFPGICLPSPTFALYSDVAGYYPATATDAKDADEDHKYVSFDNQENYLDRMRAPVDPQNPGAPTTCGDPIPTGAIARQDTYTVDTSGNTTISPAEFPDKACPNPGCTYSGAAGACIPF